MKTAACYIRVSTDKQEELSPDSQLKEIRKYAKANGYNIPSQFIFKEMEGVSGRYADKRQEFQRMIATAKQKPRLFDAVIVWKFSRFARNQDEAAFYKSVLRKKLGIDVISASEPISDGMYGRLIEMIIEWSDEFYSYNLSGEVMRGMKEKAVRGGYQASFPYGYKSNNGLPEIFQEEADIVRKIFHEYVYNKKSLADITRTLNNLGIKTSKGNMWEYRTVKYILENPFYIGKVRWNRQHHESHSIKDESEWIIADATHNPIIENKLFENAQKIFSTRNKHNLKAASSVTHWLSGIVKCSACGYSLFVGAKTSAGNTTFQCGNYIKGKCNKSHFVLESKLTSAIIEALTELLCLNIPLEYEKICYENSTNDFNLLNQQLEKVGLKEKRIKAAFREGIDTITEYKKNKEIINKERENIQTQFDELSSLKNLNENANPLYSQIKNVVDILSYSDNNQEKRDALCSIIKKITYFKEEQILNFELVKKASLGQRRLEEP